MKTVKLKFADLGLVITSNGDSGREITRRLRPGRAAMEDLGKVTKSTDVTGDQAKAILALVFPVTERGGGSWAVKEAERGKWAHFRVELERAMDALDPGR